MKRYEERRDDLAKGIASLKAGLEEPATELAIDGVLHRFEFTFELAWKTIKDYLEYIGIVEKTGSPREVIKSAFENNLIEDGEGWIDMMLARNQLLHIYDKEMSRDIYLDIKNIYLPLLQGLEEKLPVKIDN